MLDDVHNIITMEIAITRTAKYKICFLPVVILDSFFSLNVMILNWKNSFWLKKKSKRK